MHYVMGDCVTGTCGTEKLYPQTDTSGTVELFELWVLPHQAGPRLFLSQGKGQNFNHYINWVSFCQLLLGTTRDDGISLIFFDSAIFLLRLSIPEWCFSDRMASQSHSMIENRCKIRMQSSFPDTWSQHAVQPSPRVNQASADTCLLAKYHSQPQFKGLATLQGN